MIRCWCHLLPIFPSVNVDWLTAGLHGSLSLSHSLTWPWLPRKEVAAAAAACLAEQNSLSFFFPSCSLSRSPLPVSRPLINLKNQYSWYLFFFLHSFEKNVKQTVEFCKGREREKKWMLILIEIAFSDFCLCSLLCRSTINYNKDT